MGNIVEDLLVLSHDGEDQEFQLLFKVVLKGKKVFYDFSNMTVVLPTIWDDRSLVKVAKGIVDEKLDDYLNFFEENECGYSVDFYATEDLGLAEPFDDSFAEDWHTPFEKRFNLRKIIKEEGLKHIKHIDNGSKELLLVGEFDSLPEDTDVELYVLVENPTYVNTSFGRAGKSGILDLGLLDEDDAEEVDELAFGFFSDIL